MKYIKVIQNIFPFGKQEHFSFTFLVLLRQFFILRLLSYIILRIWYVFTTDEFCSLELESILSTHSCQTFMLVYRVSNI